MTAITQDANLPGRYTNVKLGATSLVGITPRFKVGYITVGATADDTDTITVDVYEKFKITKVLGIIGFIQTTANSVVALEAPTTTSDRQNLVITIGGSTNDKQRFYTIYGI